VSCYLKIWEIILPESPSFHAYNIGHLSSRAASPLFVPCTPAAVIRLLDSTGVSIGGSNAVVLGRSDIVGNPVAALLRSRDATVTQCHSRTKNIEQIVSCIPRNHRISHLSYIYFQVRQADIVVAAIGQSGFVKGSWVKPGAVVIDVGINFVPGMFLVLACDPGYLYEQFLDATKKSGQRLVGDVDEDAFAVASHITPVPGGVGPMTVALLMENVYNSAVRLWQKARERKIKPLALDIKEKVPSDIEIAMAQTPKPVTQLAKEMGLLPDELESYGKFKAKVELSVLDRLGHRKDGKYIVIAG
jgi:methylenetetrahydrofolate dehydrogenase (NADP+)/methenyltetrahydrofolate cyclohydrolase/formyltetrahydrofolate synthetase